MRTHPRRARMTTLPIAAAIALVMGGCGKSDSSSKQAAAPDSTQQHAPPTENPLSSGTSSQEHAAPTQNPLSSGTTTQAPTPEPASSAFPNGTKALEGGTRIDADGVSFVVPEGWEREVVTSSMRAAQYKVPASKADGEEGTFVVFRGIGGSPEENIQRWISQITEKPSPPQRATIDAGNGLTIHTVQMTGTYTVGTMMGGSGSPEPDTMFLGAVITGGPGQFPVFLRLTGPRTTVEPRLDEWNAVLASVKPMGPAAQ